MSELLNTQEYLTDDGAASTWHVTFTCWPSPVANTRPALPAAHTGASEGEGKCLLEEVVVVVVVVMVVVVVILMMVDDGVVTEALVVHRDKWSDKER